ncbi:class I SAM-dependent methyltransferase [Microlunatus soli]|uniref:Methyltransferase domain-containing protein n=1 Tax=Microlunatus soli TaxID=630515 RepID=A0A1H1UPS8_9ACTN|nr:class I SAM-dependent methyltransferase [Microlunatus soli]SDS74483.1 Methyltransferase domain-containing protein [Microlunatus soli]
MDSDTSRLVASARDWFSRPDQIEHYADHAADGPSELESRLLRHLSETPARVLDVGCGAGRIAVPLALQGHRVTGIDISDGLLVRARQFAEAVGACAGFERVEPTRLPYDAGSFDAVLSIKQYCYLPGSQLRLDYLAGLARVLRPGGVLLITGYIVPSEVEALAALQQDVDHQRTAAGFDQLEPMDTFSAGEGYVHWFTHDQLLDELSTLGPPIEVVDAADDSQIGVAIRPSRQDVVG